MQYNFVSIYICLELIPFKRHFKNSLRWTKKIFLWKYFWVIFGSLISLIVFLFFLFAVNIKYVYIFSFVVSESLGELKKGSNPTLTYSF